MDNNYSKSNINNEGHDSLDNLMKEYKNYKNNNEKM